MRTLDLYKGSVFGATFLVLSCGATKPDATAPVVDVKPAKPEELPPDTKKEEPSAATPEPIAPSASAEKAPEAKGPSSLERVTLLCEDHCKKVEGACKATTAETCRANCESYVIQAERCPVEVEKALSCRRDAEEQVLCSVMVAAGCEKPFANLRDCSSGKVPPLAEGATNDPTGTGDSLDAFSKFASEPLGLSLLLPKNSKEVGSGEGIKLAGQDGNIDYFAEAIPGAIDKVTDRVVLRVMTAYLGPACESKLKLHGRFEKEGATFIRFDSTCKDTTEWHGLFVVHHGRGFVVAGKKAPGVASNFVDLDTFLFSVRLLP